MRLRESIHSHVRSFGRPGKMRIGVNTRQMCVLARDGHAIATADSHGAWLHWLP